MRRVGVFVFVMIVAFCSSLESQIPQVMSYQGVLTDAGGVPVADGTYNLTYRLYDTNTGGTPLWAEAQQVVIFGGMISVTLGTQVPINLPFDEAYWLGITIDGAQEMVPRRRLTPAVPFSGSLRGLDSLVRLVHKRLSLCDHKHLRENAPPAHHPTG